MPSIHNIPCSYLARKRVGLGILTRAALRAKTVVLRAVPTIPSQLSAVPSISAMVAPQRKPKAHFPPLYTQHCCHTSPS